MQQMMLSHSPISSGCHNGLLQGHLRTLTGNPTNGTEGGELARLPLPTPYTLRARAFQALAVPLCKPIFTASESEHLLPYAHTQFWLYSH